MDAAGRDVIDVLRRHQRPELRRSDASYPCPLVAYIAYVVTGMLSRASEGHEAGSGITSMQLPASLADSVSAWAKVN